MPSGLLAAILLCLAVAVPARAQEWKQTGEGVFKGHRLTTFIDEATRRGAIRLDDRQIATLDSLSEIGRISVTDAESSVLFSVHTKSARDGCGSFVLVSVPLVAGSKGGTLANFGACNPTLTITVDRRRGWGAWYAVAYRADRAAATVALIRHGTLATQDVKAPPCLFQAPIAGNCLGPIKAEAAGSLERGIPTGAGVFADQMIETYHNGDSGKATLELNGRVLRTFENAKEFYLDSVNGESEFGLFTFWLKPAGEDCPSRPLVFFPTRASEPQVITDFAPCTDRMLSTTRKTRDSVGWLGIAYKPGDSRGFIASVVDHKLSTHPVQLPPCMMAPDGARSADCLRQIPTPTTPGAPPPRVAPTPSPAPPGSRPRAIGI